jgi:carbamoyltransferase
MASLTQKPQINRVPIVLNTSFNIQGEPIVNNPNDAIRSFFSSGLDYLIIGNYLVSKKNSKTQ